MHNSRATPPSALSANSTRRSKLGLALITALMTFVLITGGVPVTARAASGPVAAGVSELSGYVYGIRDTPVFHAKVTLFAADDGSLVTTFTTQIDGRYRFDLQGQAERDYKIYVEAGYAYQPQWFSNAPDIADATVVRGGGILTRTDLDVMLQYYEVGSITGVVLSRGQSGAPDTAVAGANVSVFDKASGSFVLGATTNRQGQYGIDDLLPQDYLVRFIGPSGRVQWFPGPSDKAKALTVPVSPSRIAEGVGIVLSATSDGLTLSPYETPVLVSNIQVGVRSGVTDFPWRPFQTLLAYQWFVKTGVSANAIAGATSVEYVPPASLAGKALFVEVTASHPGYEPTLIRTREEIVGGGTLATHAPTIAGTPAVGSKLTATPGPWGPSPVAFRYQWAAGGLAIVGATASTFSPRPADVGRLITVKVTGSKAGYTTTNRTSAATEAVRPGQFVTVRPTLSGSARVGSTLTAQVSGWTPSPSTIAYKWTADGVRIVGAKSSMFKLTSAQAGKRIVVTVTGTAPGYVNATRGSLSSAVVAK